MIPTSTTHQLVRCRHKRLAEERRVTSQSGYCSKRNTDDTGYEIDVAGELTYWCYDDGIVYGTKGGNYGGHPGWLEELWRPRS